MVIIGKLNFEYVSWAVGRVTSSGRWTVPSDRSDHPASYYDRVRRSRMRTAEIDRIVDNGVIAIFRGVEPESALDVATAVVVGGVTALEVTADTPNVLETIELLSGRFDDVLVGAGTVLDAETARAVQIASARFTRRLRSTIWLHHCNKRLKNAFSLWVNGSRGFESTKQRVPKSVSSTMSFLRYNTPAQSPRMPGRRPSPGHQRGGRLECRRIRSSSDSMWSIDHSRLHESHRIRER